MLHFHVDSQLEVKPEGSNVKVNITNEAVLVIL